MATDGIGEVDYYTASMGNIAAMGELSIPPDDNPHITATAKELEYHANIDTAFEDRNAFSQAAMARYLEEAGRLAQLDEILSKGADYMALLYTWRSCSLAIPAIKSHDQPNRMEIYQLTVDILEPEVAKLRTFFVFQKQAVSQFVTAVEHVCTASMAASEQLLHTLGQLINMFAVLDQLKNSKASVKNDYATYKRAAEILKCFNDVQRMEESQQLSMFLGTHNCILTTVKAAFQKVTGFQDVLCDIVSVCIHTHENNLYLTPAEKHSIVKIMGFSIFLIDSELVNINKLDSKRKFNLGKIDKIFKQLEVVPLFGDMMTVPFSYIEMSPNFDATKWPQCLSEQPSAQMQLVKQLPLVRQQYIQLVCELTLLCGATKKLAKPPKKPFGPEKVAPVKEGLPTGQDDQAMYDLSLRLLQTLSSWTAAIMELFSWKLLHPTDKKQNPECPEDAEEYERATRYNYSSEEKFALIEMITKIKSLQELMAKSEVQLGGAIKRHIYTSLQQLVQVDLREPLRKATKHRKEVIHSVLNGVRTMCSDIAQGLNTSIDPLPKGKKGTGYNIEVPRKQVLPSSTQMYLMRTMLASLIDKSRKSQRKELDSQHVQNIENFLRLSFFWPHLIHLKRSLQECCDLSQLWYREFYLEITMGRRIQSKCILYPLDLYNDSAHYALYNFKKQYLYDEVEAEVNLCFDQLIYSLSEQVFEHYKMLAGSIHLGRGFKNLSRKQGLKVPHPRTVRYEPLFQQQHFQLLGRSIDLKHLLTQRINLAFMKALDIAISRFESSDITAVVELEGLLEVNRLTHKLLSYHLPLVPFDALFREANHSVNVPCGRVTLSLFLEISYNFLPQYCYNMSTNRFVKTIFPFVDPVIRDKPPAAAHYYIWGSKALANCYSAIYGQYTNFVGQPHFQSMCRLLDYQDMAVVIRELLQVIKNMLDQVLVPYLKTLKAVMPPGVSCLESSTAHQVCCPTTRLNSTMS
ncbi:Cytoplasmic FMR1-interacting protein [Lamellibrachia satsuma]|nr:Cytoplasmic FMR1-interacting protein [Lamellibrachia satsuma]